MNAETPEKADSIFAFRWNLKLLPILVLSPYMYLTAHTSTTPPSTFAHFWWTMTLLIWRPILSCDVIAIFRQMKKTLTSRRQAQEIQRHLRHFGWLDVATPIDCWNDHRSGWFHFGPDAWGLNLGKQNPGPNNKCSQYFLRSRGRHRLHTGQWTRKKTTGLHVYTCWNVAYITFSNSFKWMMTKLSP
jgi:hypothetical protein